MIFEQIHRIRAWNDCIRRTQMYSMWDFWWKLYDPYSELTFISTFIPLTLKEQINVSITGLKSLIFLPHNYSVFSLEVPLLHSDWLRYFIYIYSYTLMYNVLTTHIITICTFCTLHFPHFCTKIEEISEFI